MNRKNIMYARGFLVTQMNHWAFFPILMFFFCLAKSIISTFPDPSLLLWLEVGILPFIFLIFRMKIKRFGLLLLCHVGTAVLFGALLLLESPSTGFVYVFAVGCYVIYSLLYRLMRENPQDSKVAMPLAVGLSAASLFLQHYEKHTEWDSWFIAALIAVFAMYFLAAYLERYLAFLEVNESSTGHIPEREIFSSGSRMAVLYVAFSVLVLFLTSSFGWLRTILTAVREIIFAVLRVLLSGLKSGEEESTLMQGPEMSGGGGMELPEPGKPFILWEILEVVAVIALLGGILYLVVKLLMRLPAFIRDRMGRSRTFRTESAEGNVFDVRESCEIEKPKKAGDKWNPFSFLSTEERIRKLYKKHILSASRVQKLAKGGEASPALLTAREWGTRLEQAELAAPYEKARYSGENCTAEDLRAMKSACR